MNILLVDNLVMPEDGSLEMLDIHPNLGLLALAAAAEADGHHVDIYDPKRMLKWQGLRYDKDLYEQAAAQLLSKNPDVVGFTTLGCSFVFALNVARVLKREQPDLPILLGGPHATMLDREILQRFPQFDVVVRHEADEIFAPLLKQLEQRQFFMIPGITWRPRPGSAEIRRSEGAPKVQNLDTLPMMSYDHYPIASLGLDLLRIEAGRGCPFMCTFCSTASFFQRSFRLKSATRLVHELDTLHARYGVLDFKLDHDMFTASRKKVVEFCQAVHGRPYRWHASARVDCVDEELLEQMAEAGCVGLYFGIETGSTRMQEICKKRLDLRLVEPTLSFASRVGIGTTASFITGYPEETAQDQNDTLDLLGKCFHRSCLPQLHMLAPEPGTAMYHQLGDQIQYDGYGGRYNALLVSSADERLIEENPEIFQTYYYYPAVLPRAEYIFAVEAIDLLRQAGWFFVSYLLRAYDGHLSRLISELREHQRQAELVPTKTDVVRYLALRFGARSHLIALYDYCIRVQTLKQSRDPAASQSLDGRQRYQQNPGIIHEFFDYEQFCKRLEQEPGRGILDESEVGERGTYCLLRSGDDVLSYKLDAGVETLVSLFEKPRSCEDAAAMLSRSGLPASADASIFADLARLQLIVRAPLTVANAC